MSILALVTQVCQRNFKSNPAKAIVTGADIQYGRMLDELGYEFCQEARRRQDMIRFGMFTKKSWLSHSPNGDYRALFPIPRTEIAKNSNLTQNTGY